jgi:hypothetical protein
MGEKKKKRTKEKRKKRGETGDLPRIVKSRV